MAFDRRSRQPYDDDDDEDQQQQQQYRTDEDGSDGDYDNREQPVYQENEGEREAFSRYSRQPYDDDDDDQQQQRQYGAYDDNNIHGRTQIRYQGGEERDEFRQSQNEAFQGEEDDGGGEGEPEQQSEFQVQRPGPVHQNMYQNANKPMSNPERTDPDELYQAASIVMKHLLIQTHNAQGVAAGTHNHESVTHQTIDAHPNDDWRIQYLETQDANGNAVSLQAKMDTGADANLISFQACEVHGLQVEPVGPSAPTFTVGSGAETDVDGQVHMHYSAGNPPKAYSEDFFVKDGLPHDIILGMPFLLHSHALTLNPSFATKQSSGDFLLFETTASSNKTPQDRQNFSEAAAARKQANAAAKKTNKR